MSRTGGCFRGAALCDARPDKPADVAHRHRSLRRRTTGAPVVTWASAPRHPREAPRP